MHTVDFVLRNVWLVSFFRVKELFTLGILNILSQDKAALNTEAQANLAALDESPRAFVRDPVVLEFLGLPDTGRLLEAALETALMDKLQQFLMELGKGFAFVARQQRSALKRKTFTSTWCFTTTCSSAFC